MRRKRLTLCCVALLSAAQASRSEDGGAYSASEAGRLRREITLEDELWSRMGAEADALLSVNRNGIAVAHGGLAATLRDLARFGLLFARAPDAADAGRVISDRVLQRIVAPGRRQLFDAGTPPTWLSHVAYQWDAVTDKGDFFKGGFGDQLLYVAPRKNVVIAYFATNQSLDFKPRLLPLRRLIDDLF
jgi:CubicO group peptidase (beta-lactamase class C family)